jgi:hypothetical protein
MKNKEKKDWNFTSLPVKKDTHKKIKKVSAETGEKMYEAVDRIITEELKKIEQSQT